jgi:hypothetical protein
VSLTAGGLLASPRQTYRHTRYAMCQRLRSQPSTRQFLYRTALSESLAETDDEAVVVQITGFRPSSTEYVDATEDLVRSASQIESSTTTEKLEMLGWSLPLCGSLNLRFAVIWEQSITSCTPTFGANRGQHEAEKEAANSHAPGIRKPH